MPRDCMPCQRNWMDAITQAPTRMNMTELRSFLGLLNYYRKFLPNLADLLRLLNELLQMHRKWKWSAECTTAFQQAKHLLTMSCIMILPYQYGWQQMPPHAYGIVACSHLPLAIMERRIKPIAFALSSELLTNRERGSCSSFRSL